MKPTRNRTFCNGCGKTKMLFDSQSKADNFIKFNSDTILEETGKAPGKSALRYYKSELELIVDFNRIIEKRLKQLS